MNNLIIIEQKNMYYRNMNINQWIQYSKNTYSIEAVRAWEENADIPFDEIGENFEEISDYEVVTSKKLPFIENLKKIDEQFPSVIIIV